MTVYDVIDDFDLDLDLDLMAFKTKNKKWLIFAKILTFLWMLGKKTDLELDFYHMTLTFQGNFNGLQISC